jgi:hypothetical protein
MSTLNFQALSLDSPLAQPGVSDGSNASAGNVGEYESATASSVALTTNTFTNLTSLTLSAGDWDVSGGFYINNSGGSLNNVAAGISTTSATLTQPGTYAQLSMNGIGGFGGAVPTVRVSVSSTMTVYLVGFAGIVSGSAYANGLLQARRVR